MQNNDKVPCYFPLGNVSFLYPDSFLTFATWEKRYF